MTFLSTTPTANSRLLPFTGRLTFSRRPSIPFAKQEEQWGPRLYLPLWWYAAPSGARWRGTGHIGRQWSNSREWVVYRHDYIIVGRKRIDKLLVELNRAY